MLDIYRNRGRVLLAMQVHSMVWTFMLAAPLGFWASRIVLFYSRLLLVACRSQIVTTDTAGDV